MSDQSGPWRSKQASNTGLHGLEEQVRHYRRTRKLQRSIIIVIAALIGFGAVVLLQPRTLDLPEITWSFDAWPILGGGVVLLLLVGGYIARRSSTRKQDAATERRFKNVFAFVTQERREQIIRRYMEKEGASRVRAMAIAIEDRCADEDKFR
jgi:hypothetical protein